MSDAPTSYVQQSGKTNQEPKPQSCVESQSHVSGNAAIIASNQNHQCSITPSGAELKCGCRVVGIVELWEFAHVRGIRRYFMRCRL